MVDPAYALKALALMAAATFATRAIPFVLPVEKLREIGKQLPPAAMLLLVIYCLKDQHGWRELTAVGVVLAAHLWRRQALISIGLGTAFYVFLGA